MSKHTPGPWKVGAASSAVYEPSNDARAIALMPTANWAIETREANARLIAAAPELLAALREAVPYMEAELARAFPPHNPASPLSLALKGARAAIAKAEADLKEQIREHEED